MPKKLLTPEEYLAIERKAEFKSEFYRGEMFAMPRTNWMHASVKANIARHAGNQLAKGPCHLLTSDLRVHARGYFAYPDIVVVERPTFYDEASDTIKNPHVLIEVLSESSEDYDRGTKFKMYRDIPSLQEYVLIAQDQPLVERHVRQPNGEWVFSEVRDLTQTFSFASIPVKIALMDIYRGVEFKGQQNGAQ